MKNRIKNFSTWISFFILGIAGFLFLFYGKMLIGTILIILVISGIIVQIHMKRKNIKTFSNPWVNATMFYIILTIIFITIIRAFLFNKTIYLMDIIGGTIFLLLIYLYFKVIVPKYL